MEDLSRAVRGSVKSMLDTSFDVDLVDLFRGESIQSFVALWYEIDEEGEENVSDSEVHLLFVKSRYKRRGGTY